MTTRSHFRQAAVLVAAYVFGFGLVSWLATGVHCLGDPKFNGGCAGGSLYFAFWSVHALPGLCSVILVTFFTRLAPYHRMRAGLISVGGLAVAYYGFWLFGALDAWSLQAQWAVWVGIPLLVRVVFGRSALEG